LGGDDPDFALRLGGEFRPGLRAIETSRYQGVNGHAFGLRFGTIGLFDIRRKIERQGHRNSLGLS